MTMFTNRLYLIFFILLTICQVQNLYAEILEYELTAIKVTYNDKKDLVTAIGDAVAKDTKGKTITSPKIIYDKKNKIIKTFSKSVYRDDKENVIKAENFIYDLNIKKISAIDNVKYQDKDGNSYLFDYFDYFELEEKGFGKNLKASNIDNSKIKATEAIINNKTSNTIFPKGGDYTTCDFNFAKTNYLINKLEVLKDCPEWQITSKKTRHNKIEKMIYHDHPVLKFKGVPVFYTPYFSHPDPTVKRKSGFLTPSTTNTDNYGRNLETPYFYVISDDKDLTFTPIMYFEENPLFLLEYRQAGDLSNLIIDSSYTPGFQKDRANQTDGSRNHFFLEYQKDYEDLIWNQTKLEIDVQRISQKNYFRAHDLLTPYINSSKRYLNTGVTLKLYEESKNLNINSRIVEDVRNSNTTTKYQYTLPEAHYQNFYEIYKNDVNYNAIFYARNLGGDSNKVQLVNTIDTASEQKIIQSIGIGNIFRSAFYNIEKYNDTIKDVENSEKEDLNIENFITIGTDLSYPLYKSNKDFSVEQTLEPRILAKYTPGSMSKTTSGRSFGFGQVYSMNRMSDAANPETGFSIGEGFKWTLTKKNPKFENYLKTTFFMGHVIRFDELEEMDSSLKQKSSDVVGGYTFMLDKNQYLEDEETPIKDKFNANYFSFNYDYQLDNSGKDFLGHNIGITRDYKSHRFKTSYGESRKTNGSSRNGEISYKGYLTNEFSVAASAQKNFVTHATETNSFGALYENDCIRVSATLNKKFYNDEDVKPTNNFFLEIVLKPFGDNIAPDISPLLKID